MDKSQSKAPCFLCGAHSFTWGFIKGYGDKQISFSTTGESFMGKIFVEKGDEIRARRCQSCGNILLFDCALTNED